MDKRNIAKKITEILVHTQFAHWVENYQVDPQAENVEAQKQRALKYYLGCDIDGIIRWGTQNSFNTIIKLQVGMILRILEEEGF